MVDFFFIWSLKQVEIVFVILLNVLYYMNFFTLYHIQHLYKISWGTFLY